MAAAQEVPHGHGHTGSGQARGGWRGGRRVAGPPCADRVKM